MRFSLAISLTLVALMGSTLGAGAVPAQVQHIKVDMHSPSRAGDQVREFWLAGMEYLRVDQALAKTDARETIISPSDTWQIDVTGKKGTHVPRDASLPIGIPIVQGTQPVIERFKGLIFGKEIEYFEAQKAAKSNTKDPSGRVLDVYTITEKPLDLAAILDVDKVSKKPVEMIVRRLSDKTEMTMRYLAYETIPFKQELFKPPSGIAMKSISIAEVKAKRAEFDAKMSSYREKLLKEMASGKTSATR